MPAAPARPCLRCKRRTRNKGGYCDSCQERKKKIRKDRAKGKTNKYDQDRGSASSRGYDRHWQRIRKAKLSQDSLCECSRCRAMKRFLMANTVHHIKPVETHPHLRLVMSNLKSMSRFCHEVEEGRASDYEFEEWERAQK